MTDLVSRLRERHSFLCDEAAEEIERLRGLLRDINSCQRHFDAGAWQVRLYQDHYDRIDAALADAADQPSAALTQKRGRLTCPCGFVGGPRNIIAHRVKCPAWHGKSIRDDEVAPETGDGSSAEICTLKAGPAEVLLNAGSRPARGHGTSVTKVNADPTADATE